MKKILLLTIVIVLIPLLIVGLNTSVIFNIKYGSISNRKIRVKRMQTGEIKKISIEEYVIGVVAGEMPASFNVEALKAQAVASRTYALKKINKDKEYDVTDDTNFQVYKDTEQLKSIWQDKYDEYYNKVKSASLQTKGEVILYNNDLIDAVFFSTSNGYTEDSENVFSKSLPYLRSVSSFWDEKESPAFSSESSVSKLTFLYNLNIPGDSIIINQIEKTSSGRIKTITINNKKILGTDMRKAFNLKSTSFDLKINNDTVTFYVKGYGHGVGMSQYGANGMAKEGYGYKDIILHYYKNCEIKKLN